MGQTPAAAPPPAPSPYPLQGPSDMGLTTFPQRYYVCANYWQADEHGHPGPIFFYLGNEADVLL